MKRQCRRLCTEEIFNLGTWQLQEKLLTLGLPEDLDLLDKLHLAFDYKYFARDKFIIQHKPTNDNKLVFLIKGGVLARGRKDKCHGLFFSESFLFHLPLYKAKMPGNSTWQFTNNCHAIFVDTEKLQALIGKDMMQIIACELASSTADYYARLFSYNKLSVKQKLKYLQKDFPKMFEEFKHKDIASFIGMAPETLSRNLKQSV